MQEVCLQNCLSLGKGKEEVPAEANSRTGIFLAGKRETLKELPIRNFSVDSTILSSYFPDRE